MFQDPIATYNPAPISNLTDALPEIAFNTYFSTFTPRNFPTRVILTSTTYAASLSEILAETSHETVEVYLEVRAALALANHLGATTEAWKAVRSLQERLSGIKPGAVGDRAEYCVGRVEDALGFAAGRYFVKEVFNGDSREKGTKVITGACDHVSRCAKLKGMVCQTSLNLSRIPSSTSTGWIKRAQMPPLERSVNIIISYATYLNCLQADAIRVKVGFPLSPDTRNPRSIANYYSIVKIHKTTFFENMLSARYVHLRLAYFYRVPHLYLSASDVYKKWQKLGKQRDQEAWEMYPSMVNAYFNPPSNEVSSLATHMIFFLQ